MRRELALAMSQAMSEGTVPSTAPGDDWRPAFLLMLRNSANVRLACFAAGITRSKAYERRDTDAAFRADWDAALKDACDLLRAMVWMAALSGDIESVKWLLARHDREQYGDQVRVDLTATIRREAERMASDLGVDADELIREAERIARGGR